MSSQKTGRDRDKLSGLSRIEKFHPYKTFLFFGLLGSAVLFLSLTFLYAIKVYSSPQLNDFKFPNAFVISTIVMLFSSYSISRTLNAFKTDNHRELLTALGATLVLSCIFAALQFAGWFKMYEAGYFVTSNPGVAFLYIISALHLLHVLAGLLYLASVTSSVYFASRDLVKSLVFFSNKYQQTKIEILTIYWHYVDFLWLCLFMMFLFTL